MPDAITDRGAIDEPSTSEKKKESTSEFLARAVKRFHRVDTAEGPNRQMAVDDLRFKGGDQWPAQIKAQRTLEKRPCLTINKMKTFVHQITNDQRQNRPSINVSPVGDIADPETAKMLRGLIKHIERQSNADMAYDTGFESAVSNGWGYWRILTEYEDEDSFNQRIQIARIRNPFRVYLDPDSEEPDGSDAQWCFISDLIPRAEFKENWPDADPVEWLEQSIGDENSLWNTQTHIRISEYFYKDTKLRTLLAFDNGHVGYEDELDPSYANIEPKHKREVQCEYIKWCKITAHEILEESEWPGKWIPVVKVIGDESDLEGKVTYAGLVRDAKDAQRMYNFWVSSETELIALAPKAPWIMEEGQIEDHEGEWKSANVKSLPYLLYKGTSIGGKPAPPPQRQQFAGPPAGVVQAKIAAAQDMQATTGIRFDATLQERTYDESGKALRELKRVGDLGNFHYVDNLARSLRHTGVILIDLIPKVIDTARALTILREDGSEEIAHVDPSMPQPFAQQPAPNGGIKKLYNPKLGRYDVTVTIGPNYATKRIESAEHLMQFMQALPNQAPLIADLIAKNQDWPGADELAMRLQSQLPPGLLDKGMDRLPVEARGIRWHSSESNRPLPCLATRTRTARSRRTRSKLTTRPSRMQPPRSSSWAWKRSTRRPNSPRSRPI
jgi:Phage P22-like portal protein